MDRREKAMEKLKDRVKLDQEWKDNYESARAVGFAIFEAARDAAATVTAEEAYEQAFHNVLAEWAGAWEAAMEARDAMDAYIDAKLKEKNI
jgi:hypothetical protein